MPRYGLAASRDRMLDTCRPMPRSRRGRSSMTSLPPPSGWQGEGPYAGIGMGQTFKLAREFQAMEPAEIEELLERRITWSGSAPSASWTGGRVTERRPTERLRELFDLYIRRHDLIDTWDLVDRSAIHVVGEYLVDKPRDILHELARSDRPMERRTVILSTYALIRRDRARRHLSDRGNART